MLRFEDSLLTWEINRIIRVGLGWVGFHGLGFFCFFDVVGIVLNLWFYLFFY